MRTMYRAVMLWIGLCLLCAHAPVAMAENLVQNGGFEQMDGAFPAHWAPGMWLTEAGISYVERSGDAFEGEASGFIENASPNDARWEQTLRVKPKTYYRFRCMVRAEGCDPQRTGANLSIKDTHGVSPDVHDTGGEWVPIELYGRTGDSQRELVLMARLGGYGSETTGKAWFDAVEAEEIDSSAIPADAEILGSLEPPAEKGEERSGPGLGTLFFLMALGAAFIALAVYLRRISLRSPSLAEHPRAWPPALLITLGFALAGRALVALLSPGYQVDVSCFTYWAARMAEVGPGRFYDPDIFCDYPPGYLLVLWCNGAAARALGVLADQPLMRLLLRGFPILCDIAGACLLYHLGRKRLGERASLGLAALYAFNPAVIVTGAAWGQVDAVFALGLFCVIWLAAERRWHWALPLYALCVLIKPQALMAGPLGLLALIAEIAREKRTRRRCVRRACAGLLAAAAVVAAVALPFSGNQPGDWLLEKYKGTMSFYNYATVNAANLFYLLGGNWVQIGAPAIYGVTWQMLGIVLMALLLLYVLSIYWLSRDDGMLWDCAALLYAGLFVVGLMMHERYLLPAILLLGGAYARRRDVRTLILMAGYSATMLINTGMVLAFEHLIAPYVWVGEVLGFLNMLLLALQVWTVFEHAIDRRVRERLWPARAGIAAGESAELAEERPFHRCADALLNQRDARLRLTGRDWLVMMAITLAYSVLAFWNLGDARGPQTFWNAGARGEEVIFDLGETRDFTLHYYAGISPHAFTVATSEDGEDWSQEFNAKLDEGECFRWQAYVYPLLDEDGEQLFDAEGRPRWQDRSGQSGEMTARYLRLTAGGAGLSLGEVAFHNPEGGIWPIASVASGGGDTARSVPPSLLADEQDAVPDRPGYLNGTYFDEIYHARTGYEFLNDIHTFEWTHPPLGKLLIMLGIRIFGMTPLGWRAAGTLVGVLMLPAMYLLAKQLWKRADLAAFATLLLALDCMHFTQSRISTIDSYPVLFIMLMYLCMFRYARMSFYHQKLWRTLIPLALGGLFTGLAIASKWIGLYAAAGLALIWCYTLYCRLAERRYALRSGDEALARQTDTFARDAMWTVAWCVLWFLIVPALIYYFSYAVQFRPDGGLTWGRFWDMQGSMYRYHSRLQDSHPYQSKWWQWPIIAKPMWYYSTARLPGGRVSTILAFGNPAVWWGGLAALLATAVMSAKEGVRLLEERGRGLRLDLGARERGLLQGACLLLAGFASQYMPWVLVPRSTYIYHYFASVPFIILCMAQCAAWAFRGRKRLGYVFCGAYLALTLALFIAFYPFASGAPMSLEWAQAMQWLKLPY